MKASSESSLSFARPTSVEEVTEIVAASAKSGAALLISGGGTRMHWANPGDPVAGGLCLQELSGVSEFEPDEGVVKVLAGTTIAELQAIVATEGWELPLDPPAASNSTVGGTIASAATGPRAQGFGRVADALLGLDLVGADGVSSKCGGRVVKNVTGYDMAKLYCGAFGTLGVITGAWLRLHPQPAELRTLEGELASSAENFALCRRLAKQSSVRAFVWEEASEDEDSAKIVIEWGGSAEGVEHDQAEAKAALGSALLGGGGRDGDSRAPVDQLRDARARTASETETVMRARVLGTEVFELARAMRQAGLAISVDVGLGAIAARGELAGPDAVRAFRRAAEEGAGNLLCESMPASWRNELDAFGASREATPLMATLKNRFDPASILNPGRFIMGGGSLER